MAMNQVVLDHVPDAGPSLPAKDGSHYLYEPTARPPQALGVRATQSRPA
jgi:hypothetical protein